MGTLNNEVQEIGWSDENWQIWNRVAANITKYYIILKFIFLRIIIPKFMKIKQLLHVKIATLSTLYLTVLGIILTKSIGQFWHT